MKTATIQRRQVNMDNLHNIIIQVIKKITENNKPFYFYFEKELTSISQDSMHTAQH